jgi:biotin carboxylase
VLEAKEFFRLQQGKCILKPLDSNCSKGVFIIEKENDIDHYWEESICFSKCDNALLIEQYIEGVEFTVDGIVTPAGHKSLAISEKRHYDYNPSIAYELFFSNHNDNYDYEELRKINNYFVNCSTLPVGFFTHAEYKYMNGKFYLIEIGARGGGNYIS